MDITPQPVQTKHFESWKLLIAFFCGVLSAILVIYGVLPQFKPKPVQESPLTEDMSPEPSPLAPADFPPEWYQQPADRMEGRAFLEMTTLQSPVKLTPLENAPEPFEWNIVLSFKEVNGIPFTVTRMTEVFFDAAGNITDYWVTGNDEFEGYFEESTLVSGKPYGYNISRLLSANTAYGMALEGVDEKGNELAFSLFIPLSQEVENVLTPNDFVSAAKEEGKAYIAMIPEANPVPLVMDPFFEGNQGWHYFVSLKNETDIPFYPKELTRVLFNHDQMVNVITMPGALLKEWLENDAFIQNESELRYGDSAMKQPITHVGLKLNGKDANGNELTFCCLLELSQEISQ